jgi:hypothetical protein
MMVHSVEESPSNRFRDNRYEFAFVGHIQGINSQNLARSLDRCLDRDDIAIKPNSNMR